MLNRRLIISALMVVALLACSVAMASDQNVSDTGTVVPCISIGNICAAPNTIALEPIKITNIDNLGVVDVKLTYDPSVVRVCAATDAPFDVTTNNLMNNAWGWVRIAGMQTTSLGLNIPITLSSLTFEAVGDEGSSTPLTVTIMSMAYSNATPITTYTVNSGSFTVTGTGAAAPEEIVIDEENILSTVTAPSRTISPEVDNIFRFEEEEKDTDIGISSITIRAKASVSDVQVVVQKLSSKPSLLPSPPDSVYGYFNISATVVPGEDIESARIDFKVSKLWINTNEIDDTSIRLNRYVHTGTGDWESLQTTKIREDDPHYAYYFSVTTGLSLFAITGRSKVTIPALAVTPTPTSTPTPRAIPVPPPEKQPWALIISIIIAVIVIGATAYYFYTKKKT